MALRGSGPATDWERIDAQAPGVGWIAYPDEGLVRASHILDTDAGALFVDPITIPDMDAIVQRFDDLYGVTVLSTHHTRDAIETATIYDIPLHLPAWVDVDTPNTIEVQRHPETLGETGFELFEPINRPFWREASLYDGDILIVADALGTAPHFLGGTERLGVQPFLRPFPPRIYTGLEPNHVLVGHGQGLHDDAAQSLETAIATARSTMLQSWVNGLKLLVRSGVQSSR